jgi:hypothetical protein
MSNQAIDWGSDAASGDISALKALVMVFGVLAAVIGLVMGTVFVAARSAGNSLREAIANALSNGTEQVQNQASSNEEAPY